MLCFEHKFSHTRRNVFKSFLYLLIDARKKDSFYVERPQYELDGALNIEFAFQFLFLHKFIQIVIKKLNW